MQAKSRRSKVFASGHRPVAAGRVRPSFFAAFRLIPRHASKGRKERGRGRGQESHVRFPSKLSEEMRRMCGGLPAYHTVFSICNAPRVEFSAGVLMLTNYCQLLYLIPRLSLSPLSSSALPSLHLNKHLLEEVEKCLTLALITYVNDETYRLQRIFYSRGCK